MSCIWCDTHHSHSRLSLALSSLPLAISSNKRWRSETVKIKLFYYLYALYSLKPSQVYWYVVRRVLARGKTIVLEEQLEVASVTQNACFLEYPMGASKSWAFRFLNREYCFEEKAVDWASQDMPRLWQYNLHYFDYLHDPALDDETKCFLIEDWVQKNPIGTVTAWEPYTVSLRIVNWIKYLQTKNAGDLSPAVVRSLSLQSYWLSENLELHILANHFFKNIKALVFAGRFFNGQLADKWLVTGESLLLEQIDEQLLSDGGHFERSPMYHCIFVEDLLDLIAYSGRRAQKANVLNRVHTAAKNSALFMRDLRMPDKRFPLFNDAAFGICPEPETLLDYASKILKSDLRDEVVHPVTVCFDTTGYFVLGNHHQRMIIDCGETGPRYQPGHTHCDTLSYELALGSQRVIVDTGTFNYEPGATRRYDRSTAAHNTVMIDGVDQSEVWGLFRVARRASPVAPKMDYAANGNLHFSGSHNGYKRLKFPVVHNRDVTFDGHAVWTIKDSIVGKGEHRIESFIHLHPNIAIVELAAQKLALMLDGEKIASLAIFDNTSYDVCNAVYHPEFGVEQANKVVRLFYNGVMPASLGYSLSFIKV